MARNHASFSLPLVGRARVGVLVPHADRHSLTPPPPSPPHKGEESLWRSAERRKEPISGMPETMERKGSVALR